MTDIQSVRIELPKGASVTIFPTTQMVRWQQDPPMKYGLGETITTSLDEFISILERVRRKKFGTQS